MIEILLLKIIGQVAGGEVIQWSHVMVIVQDVMITGGEHGLRVQCWCGPYPLRMPTVQRVR